jgi:hypothetical protein
VEANSTGGQGSRRAVVPSDYDDGGGGRVMSLYHTDLSRQQKNMC